MDTYYTIEEKYLQAVEEVSYGESPKALKLFNEIVTNDPLYARAHFQLAKIYYYEVKEYQTAGYHFKTCMELEPTFPDNYFHYLDLLVFLNMEKQVNIIAKQALNTAGVNAAAIYNLLGLFFEVTHKKQKEDVEDSIERVKEKMQRGNAYQYHLTE